MIRNLIILSLCLVIGSCNISSFDNEIQDIIYSPSFALPIGVATYSVRELIEDLDDDNVEIQEDDQMQLTLIYRDTALFESSDDFIAVDEVSNSATIQTNIDESPLESDLRIPFDQSFTFIYESENNELIDYIITEAGDISLDVTSTFEGPVTYQMIMGDAIRINNNQSVQISGGLGPFGSDQRSDNLDNVRTELTTVNGENTFNVQFTGEIIMQAGSSISSNDRLQFDLLFDNIAIETIVGDFAQDETELQNRTIEFNIFENFGDIGLELNDPQVRFQINNFYGIPLGVDLSRIEAIVNETETLQLSGAATDEFIVIDAPDVADIGSSVLTSIVLDKSNSNIDQLLNITPEKFNLPLTAISNPNGVPQGLNFMTKDSRLDLFTEVSVPLDLKMDGFTTDVDFNVSGDDIENAISATLNVTTTNEIPFNGSVTLIFKDEGGQILHELTEVLFNSPEVDSNGFSTGAAIQTAGIELDANGLDAIENMDQIVAEVAIETPRADQGQFVKILADYELIIELSLIGELEIVIGVN
ncbi:MAG: hypothetical protein RJQ09_11765 [Cyclobacteriaceae bacterium]